MPWRKCYIFTLCAYNPHFLTTKLSKSHQHTSVYTVHGSDVLESHAWQENAQEGVEFVVHVLRTCRDFTVPWRKCYTFTVCAYNPHFLTTKLRIQISIQASTLCTVATF